MHRSDPLAFMVASIAIVVCIVYVQVSRARQRPSAGAAAWSRALRNFVLVVCFVLAAVAVVSWTGFFE
jgi:uncharacterized membrane protein